MEGFQLKLTGRRLLHFDGRLHARCHAKPELKIALLFFHSWGVEGEFAGAIGEPSLLVRNVRFDSIRINQIVGSASRNLCHLVHRPALPPEGDAQGLRAGNNVFVCGVDHVGLSVGVRQVSMIA